MIVDSSAVVAILKQEPEGSAFSKALADAPRARMSAATLLEVSTVVMRDAGQRGLRALDDLLADANVHFEPFTAEQAQVARAAYRDYGRGSGHPAQLNLGDCFSYALAHVTREPLLFKGEDFTYTDVTPAI